MTTKIYTLDANDGIFVVVLIWTFSLYKSDKILPEMRSSY